MAERVITVFKMWHHYVAQVGLRYVILLSQPPERWITAVYHCARLLLCTFLAVIYVQSPDFPLEGPLLLSWFRLIYFFSFLFRYFVHNSLVVVAYSSPSYFTMQHHCTHIEQ